MKGKTWHKASLSEGDEKFYKDHSTLKREIMACCFPNQCYDIIIALLKCVYRLKLVSHVSDAAYGPLFFLQMAFRCVCET